MAETAYAQPEIVLDLSRLLSRINHATPTGVDRCEMAYARGLLAAVPDRLVFGAVHPIGFYGRLPLPAVKRFLDLTEKRWEQSGFPSIWKRRRFAAATFAALRPRFGPAAVSGRRRVYLQASPNNLTRPSLIQNILKKERAKFVCLVHDLIPIEYPEYARPDGVAKHERRIRTIVDLADGILANSAATLASLQPWIDRSGRSPNVAVAHLGTQLPAAAAAPIASGSGVHFVCIGTIEPRKNHLLLLNVWRDFAQQLPPGAAPKLVIIGRRGWENEQVVDMLERCTALRGLVEEHNGLTDSEVSRLLVSSRALLLPSFAEGFGMPVAEALAHNVPVICSQLPALREAGGDAPEFLDPLDGPAWKAAILSYQAESPRRADQMRRLRDWSPPTWERHIDTVLDLVDRVAV
jgi:glycosyltransferase involved in cell wall biosynthesis